MNATLEDCVEACKHSNVIEIDLKQDALFNGLSMVKIKKKLVFNDDLKLLGFTKDGIEDMTPK